MSINSRNFRMMCSIVAMDPSVSISCEDIPDCLPWSAAHDHFVAGSDFNGVPQQALVAKEGWLSCRLLKANCLIKARTGGNIVFESSQKQRVFAGRDPFALMSVGRGQNVGQLGCHALETVIRRFSRAAAAPRSSESFPSATPSCSVEARPAIIKAAAAFKSAASRNRLGAP